MEVGYCVGSNEGQLVYVIHKIHESKDEHIKNSSKSASKRAK